MKYLLVDDEELQLLKLKDSVKEASPDGEIFAFDNPVSALESAKETQYDVAFLDIELPVMNGVSLAKKLKELDPEINIIFVTGYTEYALDAHKLHASGYLTKPVTKAAIKAELADLRFPIAHSKKEALLRVECFGDFAIFHNEKPIVFSRSKSLELLAYLVYKKGVFVTSSELSTILLKQDSQSYIRTLIADIKKSLGAVKADKVLIRKFNGIAIDKNLIDCDYFDYLNDEQYAIKKYHGKFMAQYKWAKWENNF